MNVYPLSIQDRAATGFTHVAKIDYNDFAGETGATKTLAIFPESGTMTEGTYVLRAAEVLTTGFVCSDGTVTGLLVEIGDGVDPDRFLPQTQILEAATEVHYFVTSHGTATLPYAYVAADTIDAKFTIAGGSTPTLGELTAGEIYLALHIADLDQLQSA